MKVCWSLFTRFMFVSGFSFCAADMVVVDSGTYLLIKQVILKDRSAAMGSGQC